MAALGIEPNVAPPAQRLTPAKKVRPRPPLPQAKVPPEPAWRAPLVKLKLVTSLKTVMAAERPNVRGLCLDVDERFDPDAALKLPNVERLELRMRGVGGDLTGALERFGALRKLVWLEVRWADDMPATMGALRGLRELVFQGDWALDRGPETLPAELFGLTRLERLDLSEGRLREIPEGIGALKRLRELDLGANQPMTRIPEALGTLPALRWLDLQTPNELDPAHVLPILARLPKLDWLRYRADRVTALPDAVGDLRAITYLNIGRKIERLPDAIGRLSTLRSLDVEWNDLRELPVALTKLPRLVGLYLHSNPHLDLAQAVDVAAACRGLRQLKLPPVALDLKVEQALVDAGFGLTGSSYGALWTR